MDFADQRPSRTARRHRSDEPRPQPHQEEIRDENLDLTIEDSFPASDPPSSIPDPADGEAQDRHEHDDEVP